MSMNVELKHILSLKELFNTHLATISFMIRHSSSFFLSIILHLLLASVLLYIYKSIVHTEKKSEKKVIISLCNIKEYKANIKKLAQNKLVKIKDKTVPKVQKKIEIKDKIKKKEIVKKIPLKAKVLAKKKIKKKQFIKKEIVEETSLIPKQTIHQEKKKEKSLSPQKDYLNEHIQIIAQLLRDNLYYPRSARKRGITGKILVKFKLSISGEVTNLEVINSKSDILSRAAIKTIQSMSTKFPIPSEELLLHIPIHYTLSR